MSDLLQPLLDLLFCFDAVVPGSIEVLDGALMVFFGDDVQLRGAVRGEQVCGRLGGVGLRELGPPLFSTRYHRFGRRQVPLDQQSRHSEQRIVYVGMLAQKANKQRKEIKQTVNLFFLDVRPSLMLPFSCLMS